MEITCAHGKSKRSKDDHGGLLDDTSFAFERPAGFTNYTISQVKQKQLKTNLSYTRARQALHDLGVEAAGTALHPQVPPELALVEGGVADGAGGGAVVSCREQQWIPP